MDPSAATPSPTLQEETNAPVGTLRDPRWRRLALLASVFVVAACGLVYELVAAAISSYLLGDAVTQFSLVIGVFLSAMGLGAYLASFVKGHVLRTFVEVEIWIGLIGGLSSIVMFGASAFLAPIFEPIFYTICIVLGALVGIEIPLLVRLIKEGRNLSTAVSETLALDYLGALAGSLAFPLLVLPFLGLARASVVFGILNLITAGLGIGLLAKHRKGLLIRLSAASLILALAFFSSTHLISIFEAHLYDDDVIYARSTSYQRIVITRFRNDLRLYLNGHIQLSSVDEARYHEALVVPAMEAAGDPRRVLILGGGDGMAAREVLRYPNVSALTVVDLDPEMTRLGQERPEFVALNENALNSPLVHIENTDAMRYLSETEAFWDVILIDLPDPNSETLSKLYSNVFYQLGLRRLSEHGVLVTQATSPFFARRAFWCIVQTAESLVTSAHPTLSRLAIHPYHVHVPSFGEWGFVMMSREPIDTDTLQPTHRTRFLTSQVMQAMFHFPIDLQSPGDIGVNRLDDPMLHALYREGWSQY